MHAVLNLTVLVLVCKAPGESQAASIGASSLTVVASLFMAALSCMEHGRSLRTSFLLTGSLFITVFLDIAQCRTLFLRDDASPISQVFAATLCAKAIVLFLETKSKSRWYLETDTERGVEEASGLFSLCTFSWLTALIAQGYRRVLRLETLPCLDTSISTNHQQPRFERAWAHSSRQGRARLLDALAKSAGIRGLYAVLPRIVHIGFTLCQPFLVQGISQYLQRPASATSSDHGYGWIGAAFLAYSGMAITSSLYWYHHERALARMRTNLVAIIFRQTTCLGRSHSDKSSTLTLMSTDVERIQRGMHGIHEVWANAIEVGLAAWLLYRQIGVAFSAPLGYMALCVALSISLGRFSLRRQGDWMKATQNRVGSISKMIAGMKSLKMLGLSAQLADTVGQQRDVELHSANGYRLILLLSAVVGFSPLLFTPVLSFAATSRSLDTSRLFTSLALLLLVTSPMAQLLQVIPQLISTLACFDRIATFLDTTLHVDTRVFSPSTGTKEEAMQNLNTVAESRWALSIASGDGPCIIMQNLTFGFTPNQTVLDDITLSIPLSMITMIVGPVGSGKSTLCRALLGDICAAKGFVEYSRALPTIAYCDQTPWLPNDSI